MALAMALAFANSVKLVPFCVKNSFTTTHICLKCPQPTQVLQKAAVATRVVARSGHGDAGSNGTKSFKAWFPTALTFARVLAVPALAAICLSPSFHGQRAAASLTFVLASVSDWADGYLARRWRVTSAFGAFLDPVADKLMVAAALIAVTLRFARSAAAPALALSAIVIITREIFVSALREWMASAVQGGRDIVKVGFAGKVKTATQMIALSVLLYVHDATSVVGRLGTLSLCISAALALYSAAGYVMAALPTFRKM